MIDARGERAYAEALPSSCGRYEACTRTASRPKSRKEMEVEFLIRTLLFPTSAEISFISLSKS